MSNRVYNSISTNNYNNYNNNIISTSPNIPSNSNFNLLPEYKPLTSKNVINFSVKSTIIPNPKTSPKIICFSRRRKFPKKYSDLTGYLVTMSFFIIFSLMMSICLIFSRKNPNISNEKNNFYTKIIISFWITSIISMLSLTDAASADPGVQRGTPISKQKFDKGNIKKFVGGEKYLLKYCTTCHLIRDVRTFHCNTCGICIEKHDHHCNYLSNCVGIGNYSKFFLFMVIACVHVSIIFFTCCYYIYTDASENVEFAWIMMLMSIVLIFGGFFEVFLIWMIIQHLVTIIMNRTTREFIKNKEYGVYNKGCKENCKEAFCRNTIREI